MAYPQAHRLWQLSQENQQEKRKKHLPWWLADAIHLHNQHCRAQTWSTDHYQEKYVWKLRLLLNHLISAKTRRVHNFERDCLLKWPESVLVERISRASLPRHRGYPFYCNNDNNTVIKSYPLPIDSVIGGWWFTHARQVNIILLKLSLQHNSLKVLRVCDVYLLATNLAPL